MSEISIEVKGMLELQKANEAAVRKITDGVAEWAAGGLPVET